MKVINKTVLASACLGFLLSLVITQACKSRQPESTTNLKGSADATGKGLMAIASDSFDLFPAAMAQGQTYATKCYELYYNWRCQDPARYCEFRLLDSQYNPVALSPNLNAKSFASVLEKMADKTCPTGAFSWAHYLDGRKVLFCCRTLQ